MNKIVFLGLAAAAMGFLAADFLRDHPVRPGGKVFDRYSKVCLGGFMLCTFAILAVTIITL